MALFAETLSAISGKISTVICVIFGGSVGRGHTYSVSFTQTPFIGLKSVFMGHSMSLAVTILLNP